MASSMRGRAVRLLDSLVNQTLVNSARNISRSLSGDVMCGVNQGYYISGLASQMVSAVNLRLIFCRETEPGDGPGTGIM